MKKTINAQLTVQESKVDVFLDFAKDMIIKSNAETGCITYKLMQGVNQKNDFLFFEEYENEQAVEFHNSSDHIAYFLKHVAPLLVKAPIIEVF